MIFIPSGIFFIKRDGLGCDTTRFMAADNYRGACALTGARFAAEVTAFAVELTDPCRIVTDRIRSTW